MIPSKETRGGERTKAGQIFELIGLLSRSADRVVQLLDLRRENYGKADEKLSVSFGEQGSTCRSMDAFISRDHHQM